MANESTQAGEFFEVYAGQFDSIYDTQANKGISGWVNRTLRTSMAVRFEKTFAALRPMQGRSVLDVGCGSGRYITPCLRLGASRVLAMDLSEQMLALAEDHVKEAGLSVGKVEFVCADFFNHSATEKYDYAIVMGVMDYIGDADAFLDKLMRCVTQKAVLSFPAAESVLRWQRKCRYWLRGCPLRFYRQKEIASLIEDMGVSVSSIERIFRDYFVILSP